MATLAQYASTFDQAGEQYHILPLQNGFNALLTRRGARILGLFSTPESANLFWTHPALAAPEDFAQFAAAEAWNLGGERCWIAPEIQYNITDRDDFFGTLGVDPAMDPGSFTLTATDRSVKFTSKFSLTAHVIASGQKQLAVERVVRPVDDPLRHLSEYAALIDGVRFAGYEQTATLTERNQTPIYSEIWNLVQLNAGGLLLIPCTGTVEASEYFGSAPEEVHQVKDNHVRLHITGQRQYKVGYKAATLTGRMGYWNKLPDGQEYLLIRQFFNNPSAFYVEEPPAQPGVRGHSVHIYNDDGGLGGPNSFGEMECSGQTIGGASGRSTSTDTFVLWAYVGASAAIRHIAQVLLGVRL